MLNRDEVQNVKGDVKSLREQILELRREKKELEAKIITYEREVSEFKHVQTSLTYKLLLLHRTITHVLFHPSHIFLAVQLFRREGMKAFLFRVHQYFLGRRLPQDIPQFQNQYSLNEQYQEYLYFHELTDGELKKQREKSAHFSYQPLISIIVPIYNIDPKWLDICFESVVNQSYTHWEICAHDDASTKQETIDTLKKWREKDPRIKVSYGKRNQHISGASNDAYLHASGEYIALLDNDDDLSPDALYEVVKKLNEKKFDIIYSDEDKVTIDGTYVEPHFKPEFSPDLLLSQNYITHFFVFHKDLLGHDELPFRKGMEGAQDHDLILRLTERTQSIAHISKVLYHWRKLDSSTSTNPNAKPELLGNLKKVIEDALVRRNIAGEVVIHALEFAVQVKRTLIEHPLVSIVIPFKDQAQLLKVCVESILRESTYEHFEIIGISNNSTEEETFELMKKLEKKDSRIHFYEHNVPFNFSEINNYAVRNYAKGKHILFLNNDTEVLSPDWIERMLEHSQREEVGAVGAKLYYPDMRIQHAGVIIGLGGVAGHSHKLYESTASGYANRLRLIQDVSAVTAACMMMKKELFLKVGGFEENKLRIAFNDVDLCLRVRELGCWNIFTPYAELIHYESISRGAEDSPEKIARFQKEIQYMKERHRTIITEGDPFYNKNLTLAHEDFSLQIQ